jgi:hypothetical protein
MQLLYFSSTSLQFLLLGPDLGLEGIYQLSNVGGFVSNPLLVSFALTL